MSYETNHHPTSPENSFPLAYDEVIAEHPQIPVVLKTLADKRELRITERKAGRYSDDHRDSTVPGFIGMGYEKATLGVDGFAVKVLHEHPQTHYTFDDQIAHLKRGEGVDGLEQLVTGDRESDVIVTTLMPGQSIATISATKLSRQVTSEHIKRLEATLSVMRERELDFDNVGNVLFDPEEGFSVVDYRFITHDGSPIDSQDDPSTTERYQKRQTEMSVATILEMAATMRSSTSKVMLDGYGEFASSHVPRAILGKLALKASFSRFKK
jgi:hypothetical protein